MKRIRVIFYMVVALFLLVLFLHVMNQAPNQELPRTLDGMELTMEKEVYITSAEKIGIVIHNNSETEYTGAGGGKFTIDRLFAGSWYKVPFKSDSFTTDALGIPPGETALMYTAVSELDAELTPGKYRARYGGMAIPFEVME
ncbi:immunoglobulin-like domain-containing protein [Planococcus chinensis]|uniref:Immunoglobulin-like domain-containing protein n=1 Tax=Planococcus chinensis TaxID=272917 RepID=A0ABW4QLT7_9BACL